MSAKANGRAFEKERAPGEGFGGGPVEAFAALESLPAFIEDEGLDPGMNVEPWWGRGDRLDDFAKDLL